jgi:hypothetical protein
MIAFVGCEDDTPEPYEPEQEETEEMIERVIDDANTINVSISMERDAKPFEMHHIEVSDFELREPQCTTPPYSYEGNIYNYDEDGNYTYNYDEDGNYTYNYGEEKAILDSYTFVGNKAYMLINCDYKCINTSNDSHEFYILEYDLDTDEYKEVYTYSDPDNGVSMAVYGAGEHIYMFDSDKYTLYEMDRETNEIEELRTFSESNVIWYLDILSYDNELNFTFSRLLNLDEVINDGADAIIEHMIYSFDTDTREWTEKNETNTDMDGSAETTDYINYDNGMYCEIKTNDDNAEIIVEDKYRLTYSDKNIIGSVIGYNEKGITWRTSSNTTFGGGETYIKRYDVNDNNLYVVDASSLGAVYGSFIEAGDGLVVISSSLIYYMIPESGLTFVLTPRGDYTYNRKDGNRISVTEFDDMYNAIGIYYFDVE